MASSGEEVTEDGAKRFVVVKFETHEYEVVSRCWLKFCECAQKWYCWFPTNPTFVGKLLDKHPQAFHNTMQGAVALYPLARAPFPSHYFRGKGSL
jgi:hypothetical protein